MSYHLPPPRRTHSGPQAPKLYALDAFGAVVPLSNLPQGAPARENAAIRKLVIAVVVIAVVVALIWWLNEQRKRMEPNTRRRASRASTQEMARNLHRRLQTRGGANKSVMRSLAQLGSDA